MSDTSTPTITLNPPEPACHLHPSDHEVLLPEPVIPDTPRGEEYIAPPSSSTAITNAVINAYKIQTLLLVKRRRLRDILDRLEYEEDYIDYYIRSHHVALSQSALRRMPSELLIEIFKLVLSAKGIFTDTGPEISNRNLFRLTWVCQRWRYVILDAPILWSTFSVPKTLRSPQMFPPTLQTYLERSQKVPLNVTVSLNYTNRFVVLDLLRSQPRCKSFRLVNWDLIHMSDVREEIQPTLSKIESLKVDCGLNSIAGFPELSALRTLAVKSFPPNDSLQPSIASVIPWWSLTSLTTFGLLSTILGILPFTESLVELVAGINEHTERPMPSDLIHLRRLRRLTIITADKPESLTATFDDQKQVRLIRRFLSHIYTNDLDHIAFPNASIAQVYSQPLQSLNLLYVRHVRTSGPRWLDDSEFIEAQSAFFSDNTPSLRSLEVASVTGTGLGKYGVRTLHSITTSQFAHSLTSFTIRFLDLLVFEDISPLLRHPPLEYIKIGFVARDCGSFNTAEKWVWGEESEQAQVLWWDLCEQVRTLQRTTAKGLDIRLSLRSVPDVKTDALVY